MLLFVPDTTTDVTKGTLDPIHLVASTKANKSATVEITNLDEFENTILTKKICFILCFCQR